MLTLLLLNRTPAQRFPDFHTTPLPVPEYTFSGIKGTSGARWDTGVRKGKKGTLNPCATVPPFPPPPFPHPLTYVSKSLRNMGDHVGTGAKMKK